MPADATLTTDQARLLVRPDAPGVELLHACYRAQRFDRHFHEDYALGVIEDGALQFRYLGQEMTAAAGQVNLVVPGEPHNGHAARGDGWAYRMFYLAPDVVDAACAELAPHGASRPSPSPLKGPHFTAGVLDDPVLAALIARTHRLWAAPTASLLARQTALLNMLTAWIARHAQSAPRSGLRPGLPRLRPERGAAEKARSFLYDRYAEDLSLEALARHAGLSPFHLVRVFKARYGLAPHAYLVQVRLARARGMLETSHRLADIAAATGFADQSHLTRCFKRRYGLTPGALRNFLQNPTGFQE